MMNIREKKRAEIMRRLSALGSELDTWQEQSQPKKPFAAHQSQILRISNQLRGLEGEIVKRIAASKDLLDEGKQIQRMSLELHRIWEFFRSKLAQRNITWYHNYLCVADELAWACYKPARDLVRLAKPERALDITEPPLVFLNGASTPLSFMRDASYDPEPSLFDEPVATQAYKDALKRMPVPVIGIPWFQVAHLPDALLIAHEVGHVWEDFLEIGPRLHELINETLAAEDAATRAAYNAWSSEIFGDLSGCAALGPAFVDALMHFLAASPKTVEIEQQTPPDWKGYPTIVLRVRFGLQALQHLGFGTQADELAQRWRDVYGDVHKMSHMEAAGEKVVEALLDGSFSQLGGKSLRQVLPFDENYWKAAQKDAKLILFGMPPASKDIRVLFAAASIAYTDNPGRYEEKHGHQGVIEAIMAVRQDPVRKSESAREKISDKELNKYDMEKGAELSSLLSADA
jgi:hypothetical protein